VRARAPCRSSVCARVRSVRICLWSLDAGAPFTRRAAGRRGRLARLGRRRSEQLISDKDGVWSCLVPWLFRALPLAVSRPPVSIALFTFAAASVNLLVSLKLTIVTTDHWSIKRRVVSVEYNWPTYWDCRIIYVPGKKSPTQ